MGGEAIFNFTRRHQSCHNYHLPSHAQETQRQRPLLSPACFTHKQPRIYGELFALPPSLGKIRVERQSLILCVGIKVVTTTICPLPLRKQKDHAHHSPACFTHNYHLPSPAKETERAHPLLSPACFTHKRQQIYRELFALPPLLGKIREERQSLILCVHVSAFKPVHLPLEAPKYPPNSRDPHAAILLDTS